MELYFCSPYKRSWRGQGEALPFIVLSPISFVRFTVNYHRVNGAVILKNASLIFPGTSFPEINAFLKVSLLRLTLLLSIFAHLLSAYPRLTQLAQKRKDVHGLTS